VTAPFACAYTLQCSCGKGWRRPTLEGALATHERHAKRAPAHPYGHVVLAFTPVWRQQR